MFSSSQLYEDWLLAEPDERNRNNSSWEAFIIKMKEYYKPAENRTLKNFHFIELQQEEAHKSFPSCKKVEKEAKHCYFKFPSNNRTAEKTYRCFHVHTET